jgi:hypothetical protein
MARTLRDSSLRRSSLCIKALKSNLVQHHTSAVTKHIIIYINIIRIPKNRTYANKIHCQSRSGSQMQKITKNKVKRPNNLLQ